MVLKRIDTLPYWHLWARSVNLLKQAVSLNLSRVNLNYSIWELRHMLNCLWRYEYNALVLGPGTRSLAVLISFDSVKVVKIKCPTKDMCLYDIENGGQTQTLKKKTTHFIDTCTNGVLYFVSKLYRALKFLNDFSIKTYL